MSKNTQSEKGYAMPDYAVADRGNGLRLVRVWFPCDSKGNKLAAWQYPRKFAVAMSKRILNGEKA